MSNITCEGCFHCTKKECQGNGDFISIPGTDQECSICIRNPSNLSRRDLEREVEIDGIKFKAPLDMFIARDRMKFEDFMRTKKILEAMESIKRSNPQPKDPDNPWINWPGKYPYQPQYPVYWADKRKWTANNWMQTSDNSGEKQ